MEVCRRKGLRETADNPGEGKEEDRTWENNRMGKLI
jgi:hypothetical protein